MKLPRWLLVVLVLTTVVSVLVVAGWSWYTWPSRTIQLYTRLLEQGRLEEANRMLQSPSRWVVEGSGESVKFVTGKAGRSNGFSLGVWQSWCSRENLHAEPRSVADIVQGRQRFSFHGQFTTPFFIGGGAERGVVIMRCEPWAASP
jgi:hypothetical protein